MTNSPYKEFIVKSNIDYGVINSFIDFYNNREKDQRPLRIEFIDEDSNIRGEVDAVFLSYLMLFLSEDKRDVIFIFNENIPESRIYSLQCQLAHILLYFPSINLIVYKSKVNINTGEIIVDESRNYLKNKLEQSENFIPLVFIDNNLDLFFKNGNFKSFLEPLYKLYYDSIINVLPEVISKTDNTGFIAELEIEKLNFLELTIFRLLLNKDKGIYELIGKKGGGSISDESKLTIIKRNKEKIKFYKAFVVDLVKGIKELAMNIDHSSNKKGVISARIYDKIRLKQLKSEVENEYIDSINFTNYFLDINIVDLGDTSVRNTYIGNLKLTKRDFQDKIEQIFNNSDSLEIIKSRFNIDFNNDIEYINSENFEFNDFYEINQSKIINVSHQQNKLISRIGLHFFTQLIKEKYNGFIKASSQNEIAIVYKNRDKSASYSLNINQGTSYNTIIPLSSFITDKKLTDYSVKNKSSIELNTFFNLSNYKIYNFLNDKSEVEGNGLIPLNIYKTKESESQNKYDNIIKLYLDITSNSKYIRNEILVIDASINSFSFGSEDSEWIRLLSALSQEFNDIIIYNIDSEDVKNIFNIRKAWTSAGLDFWIENSSVLFYSRKYQSDKSYYRYGANILFGKSTNEFDIINTNIWNHRYSHQEGFFNIANNSDRIVVNKKSKLFYSNNLIYFELLLTDSNLDDGNITLFEKSVQYSLNTNFLDKSPKNTNNKGYKIVETHFRLGSKIHIRDFYYAKKMFQNSFFTTPLSYLLAKEIWDKRNGNIDDYTLVGYEDYSHFLVSTVRNFLMNFINDKNHNLNHCTIDKDGYLSISPEKLNKNILIIVPIATTFNTSIKIENQISSIVERKNKRNEQQPFANDKTIFVEPFYNIVIVGHQENNTKFQDLTEIKDKSSFVDFNNDILKNYSWKSILKNEKIVKVNTYNSSNNNNQTRDQKFFISLYTTWNNAEGCELCFSKNILEEKCLIETSSSSITPRLILGMPKTKPTNSYGKQKLDLSDSLLYGYLKKKNNSYLYFNRTAKIVKKNEERIIEWLKNTVKIELQKKIVNKKVVLVSPSSGSRSQFIDLVNEYVFEFSSNCLILTLQEDYIENAESLYADGLYNADIVIYIDDVLSTINSFLETNYIVKYIRNKNNNGVGIDYCISLINRMSFDGEENLLLKLVPLVNNESSEIVSLLDESFKLRNNNGRQQNDLEHITQEISAIGSKIDILRKNLSKKNLKLNKAENRLFYYAKLNTPNLDEPNNEFPLKKERQRYDNLAKTSSLDSIRVHFSRKRYKLNPNNLKDIPQIEIKDYADTFKFKTYKHKKLYQLIILNATYKLFEFNNDTSDKTLVERKILIRNEKLEEYFNPNLEAFNSLKNKIKTLLTEEHPNHKDIILNNETNLEYVILKVICSTPLVYYKQIRESSFNWILNLLNVIRINQVDKLTKDNLKDFFKVKNNDYFTEQQKFQFLLKRSVELKSNFIIHPDFFNSIGNLINILKVNQDDLRNLKKISEEKLIEELKNLYFTTEYLPAKKIIFEYYQDLYHLELVSIPFNMAVVTKFENNELCEKNIKDYLKIIDNEAKDYIDRKKKEKENYLQKQLEGNLSKIGSKIMPFKDDNEEMFIQEYKKIKALEKYNITTSRELINKLVALIQELIYDHETKASRLESNVNTFITLSNDYFNNSEDGNFEHYLRILRLENTESIDKFWEYVKPKELDLESSKINIAKINKLSVNYKYDPKYNSIRDLQQISYNKESNETDYINANKEEALIYYLMLKSEFHNQTIKENQSINSINPNEDSENRIENFVRNKILKYISKIISNEIKTQPNYEERIINAFLTVNYDKITNPSVRNLYTFSLNKDSDLNLSENSITYKFLNGIQTIDHSNDSVQLSNLEILVDENGNVSCREGILKDEIKTYNDLDESEKLYPRNSLILLIRITDFKTDTYLFGQAVFTFILRKNERIDETRLRLLLNLRKDIRTYLIEQSANNTFLELLRYDEKNKHISHLKHSIGKFTNMQQNLFDSFSVKKHEEEFTKLVKEKNINSSNLLLEYLYYCIEHYETNEKVFMLITNSIKGQTGAAIESIDEQDTYFDFKILNDIVNTIFSSDFFGSKVNVPNDIYENLVHFTSIKVSYVLVKVIIPEILINMKKYGTNFQINWIESNDYLFFYFKNHFDVKNKPGYGFEMCKELSERIKSIKLDDPTTENSKYIVKLRINKNESTYN